MPSQFGSARDTSTQRKKPGTRPGTEVDAESTAGKRPTRVRGPGTVVVLRAGWRPARPRWRPEPARPGPSACPRPGRPEPVENPKERSWLDFYRGGGQSPTANGVLPLRETACSPYGDSNRCFPSAEIGDPFLNRPTGHFVEGDGTESRTGAGIPGPRVSSAKEERKTAR